MAAPSSEAERLTSCRAMVAGFGVPGQRDLDFGRQFVRCVEDLAWPEDVVVEDLSWGPTLVLQRLQELRPAKLVLVGSVARGLDPPGTLRCYVPAAPAPAGNVHEHLVAGLGGMIDLDHTLSVVRHWGALPAHTVVIEVEPADTSPGLGFSEELAATIDTILTIVREQLSRGGAAPVPAPEELTAPAVPEEPPSQALLEFVDYARGYERAMELLDGCRPRLCPDGGRAPDGLAVASRSRPWGSGLRIGGDWHDVVPLDGGWVGLMIGDAPGRGAEAAAVMSQLRSAALAYALAYGEHPGRVVRHLDRLVRATDTGEMATLLYVAVHPVSGTARLARAGHCPLLVIAPSRHAAYVEEGLSVPLGVSDHVERPEAQLSLAAGTTLVLFTDGLVEGRRLAIGHGLAQLRLAAANGPSDLEDLCDHVMSACTAGRSPDDDVSLLACAPTPSAGRPAPGRKTHSQGEMGGTEPG